MTNCPSLPHDESCREVPPSRVPHDVAHGNHVKQVHDEPLELLAYGNHAKQAHDELGLQAHGNHVGLVRDELELPAHGIHVELVRDELDGLEDVEDLVGEGDVEDQGDGGECVKHLHVEDCGGGGEDQDVEEDVE